MNEQPADGAREPAIGRHERESQIGRGRRDDRIAEPRHDAMRDEPSGSMCHFEARCHENDLP